jgi:hypothetical protein
VTDAHRPSDERACPNGCGPLEPFATADIGVGVQNFGPWGCPLCHYVDEPFEPEIELDEGAGL